MRVTALGHAGLKVETARATLLLDPWFSPEGAFQGSWFQFPDNSHLLTPQLLRPTAIAISHEHLDHVDPWFLAQVPSDVPVIVPRYPSPALRQKIALGGPRTVIEASQWEPVELADGTSVFFVSEPPIKSRLCDYCAGRRADSVGPQRRAALPDAAARDPAKGGRCYRYVRLSGRGSLMVSHVLRLSPGTCSRAVTPQALGQVRVLPALAEGA